MRGLRAALPVLCAWFLLVSGSCGGGDAPGAVDSDDAGGGGAGGDRSPIANNCVGIDCPCRNETANKNYCGGKCVSLQDDASNCGACGQACGPLQTCERGACTCPTGEMWCSASCVQIATDFRNCGGCGIQCNPAELCAAGSCKLNLTGCSPPCANGQSCTAGRCACPSGQSLCGGRCVDTVNNPDHCGSCDKACAADIGCTNGVCGCTRSQTACSSGCADIKTDINNCGACGKVCGASQTCSEGSCKNAWSDGCGDDPAHELRMREVAVYQTVKIPITAQGSAVEAASRPVPIVQSRAALFRVYVDLGSNFSTRDFAARLTITNDGATTRYSQKQRISVASTDAKSESTFIMNVPADKITATTKYSVQLVECAAGSGSVTQARFPTSGEADLGARKVGGLKVTLLPVFTNSKMPDVGTTALDVYRKYLEAMYPVEKVTFTIGQQIKTDYPINWTTLVEQIRAQRKADSPAKDVYYYGLVKPTDTLSAYCKTGCTAGIGYVSPAKQTATRAAVGLAFGDEVSAATMAHELGHNHGRNHAPCSPSKISGVDESYPVKNGRTDVWGYDWRKQIFTSPSGTNDIMGYCEPKWASAYTYKSLLDRVVYVNEIDGVPPQEILPTAPYRVMIVEPEGPRWSLPFDEPVEAYGTREPADLLNMSGQVIAQIEVYRTVLSEDGAATVLVPPPENGWYAVRVRGTTALPFEAPVTVPDPE